MRRFDLVVALTAHVLMAGLCIAIAIGEYRHGWTWAPTAVLALLWSAGAARIVGLLARGPR